MNVPKDFDISDYELPKPLTTLALARWACEWSGPMTETEAVCTSNSTRRQSSPCIVVPGCENAHANMQINLHN